jgi:hypothetical protein
MPIHTNQLPKSPQQLEDDAGDVAVAEGFQQKQIPTVLGAEADGNKEDAGFCKDRKRADGEAEGGR